VAILLSYLVIKQGYRTLNIVKYLVSDRIELVPVTCASTPGGGVDLQIMLNPPPKPPPALTKSGMESTDNVYLLSI
jgi:hypothetical protein